MFFILAQFRFWDRRIFFVFLASLMKAYYPFTLREKYSGTYFPSFGLNTERYTFSPNAENPDQRNSEYGHFSRSVTLWTQDVVLMYIRLETKIILNNKLGSSIFLDKNTPELS